MSVRLKAITAAWFTVSLTACYTAPDPAPNPDGQSAPPGLLRVVVSGTVMDSDGAPCAGANVAMQSWAQTTSDNNGRYTLPAVNTVPGTALPISAWSDDCLAGETSSAPATTSTVNVDFKLARVNVLPNEGSTTAILRTTDPAYTINSVWEDESKAWQSRQYRITTPADTDISVELDWERVGNSNLQIWTASGQISQTVDGKQVLRLPQNQKAWLAVVQPQGAGPLSMPVRFTLETRRAGG